MNATIRRAVKDDIPRIMELLRLVNDIHAEGRPDIFIRGRTKYTPAELEAILADPETPVFVCENADGGVAGYAFCRLERVGGGNQVAGRELYIDDICFSPDHHGSGLPARLCSAVEDFARAEGCQRITLHAWECNPRAIRFYEKQGMSTYFQAMEKRLGN